MGPYSRLGAWVDLYDYVLRDHMDPAAAVDEMARRGVRTLYLQTSKWNIAGEIHDPGTVTGFLDRAHAKGIKVVGWYVPGFGDVDRDLRRSLAVLEFRTPSGERFDGFAPDIEDRREVDHNLTRFNAGIVEYSRRLRGSVPESSPLGAIVVDAKNNERVPARWEGFPWHDIAHRYDVVMPMAYWSVTKTARCGTQLDVADYLEEVVGKTRSLMRSDLPLHLIGGIADCITVEEVAAYAGAARSLGSVGTSLYDFATMESSPGREDIWRLLGAGR